MTTHDIAEFLVGSVFIIAVSCVFGISIIGLAATIQSAVAFIKGDRSRMTCQAITALFVIATYLFIMAIIRITK